MARNWKDVKAELVERGLSTDETRARARAVTIDYVHAYRLSEVRKQLERTQKDVAAIMGVDQSRISQIENGDLAHTELATLQSYVHALGGHVRIVADFGDSQIPIA